MEQPETWLHQPGNGCRRHQDTVPTYDRVKGRLTSLTFSSGTDTFGYDATSGS